MENIKSNEDCIPTTLEQQAGTGAKGKRSCQYGTGTYSDGSTVEMPNPDHKPEKPGETIVGNPPKTIVKTCRDGNWEKKGIGDRDVAVGPADVVI